jgi:hypothetical protein
MATFGALLDVPQKMAPFEAFLDVPQKVCIHILHQTDRLLNILT